MPFVAAGRIPVVYQGRHQALDSLARNSLLVINHKQRLNLQPWKGYFDSPKIIPAVAWLMELMTDASLADTRPCFSIDNTDLKTMLKLPMERKADVTDGKRFSYNEMAGQLQKFMVEAQRISAKKVEVRNAYERSVGELSQSLQLYLTLRTVLGPCAGNDFAASLKDYRSRLDPNEANDATGSPLLIPGKSWNTVLGAVKGMTTDAAPPMLQGWADMAAAWRSGDGARAAAAIAAYTKLIEADPDAASKLPRARTEQLFNKAEPFYRGMNLCVIAFLLVLLVWIGEVKFEWARKSAFVAMVVVFALLSAGIIYRMIHEGRPPVTNLYSSAIFIGWGAMAFGLVVELLFKKGIGTAVASMVGFGSLMIAHYLSLDGDTMIMLSAVLDTNGWLATHVVTVTMGYVATFVAGAVGIIYVLMRLLGRMDAHLARLFAGITFGVMCFAVLFSFIGTVLGGIWADQSWGRFWGWDPKENGALLIVIWNAIILHARWGGMVKERGMMVMAVFGNIITSWSWFGTNMLGIGLHSYGFTDAAFFWLSAFILSQLVIMGLAFLP